MSKILDKLADQHEERLINTLYRLEDDIIKSYDKLVYSGKLSGEIEKQKSKIITSALSIAEKYL